MALQTRVEKIIKPALVSTPGKSGLLQRKCSRCNTDNVDNEREDDQKKHLVLQRRAASEADLPDVPPIVHDVLHSSGEPLDSETRAFMEPRFGHDFSNVRVHADDKAAESARAVNALAYTVGQDVVFGTGQYALESLEGKRLLAHELAHTLQQGRSSNNVQSELTLNPPSDKYEHEADQIANRVQYTPELNVNSNVLQQGFGNVWIPQSVIPISQRASGIQRQSEPETEDPGKKRAKAAEEMVTKLKAAGATYKQEQGARDWNNYALSDCSKFVQWVLETSGEEKIFGREKATTSLMRETIQKLTEKEQVAFRKTDPKVGDIMMWEKHVAIVTEIVEQKGTKRLVYANVGSSGATLIGKYDSTGKEVYWLKANDIAKIDEMGAGAFLGFWTP